MMKKIIAIGAGSLLLLTILVFVIGSSNPETPAGYVGYVTRGAVFGKTNFYGLQTGPTSSGLGWMLGVMNVSITPYTYTEEFTGDDSVLSKDNLKISFRVHLVWKIRSDRVQQFFENYSVLYNDKTPDKVVMDAYNNYLKEPLRTYARDQIQQLPGLEIKNQITPSGNAILKRVQELTGDTPFEVSSVVVGNIQYPSEVADAVSRKMATTQTLEQKQTEIEIARKNKEIRVADAEGIAKAMDIIRASLTPQYLQHEAIDAQKAMVGSPNHTTIYIPVGPMGVPVTGTFPTSGKK